MSTSTQQAKILVLDRSEVLPDQIREATALRESGVPEVVACTRVGAVADLLEEQGAFDVLVAGPSVGTRAGLARLELIRHEYPTMSIVLAFSRRPEARLRDIVRSGAIDLVELPVEDEELATCLERAIELSQMLAAISAHAAQVAVGTASSFDNALPVTQHSGPGRVFTVASATGGCGKTFYATNLAYFIAHHTSLRVCVVDLDLQFGEVSTALRLRPRYTIYDALQREDNDEEALVRHIEEYMVLHETNVHVLAAPKDPSEADTISPPDVTRIVEAVRNRFDYVIVDTPAQLSETVLAAFDLSELLICMATLDLPSVRNMKVFLDTLEKLKIPTSDVRLILNKAETDVGIDIPQIEKLFAQGFSSTLPYAKEVSRSINMGTPVMASSPQSEISILMARGMLEVLPPAERVTAEQDLAAYGGRGMRSRIAKAAKSAPAAVNGDQPPRKSRFRRAKASS